jgi:dihydrofolate reductase
MRKIVAFDMLSVDGYFAGPAGELDWHHVDREFNEFVIPMLKAAGTLLFGRITYDLMAAYWPTPIGARDDPVVAGLMNSLPKIVFSKSLDTLSWNNCELMRDIVPEELFALKNRESGDMLLLGSGTIVSAFAKAGLIDEYRFIVNPVILGKGKWLFDAAGERIKLKLINSKRFESGNVLLDFEPVQ